ncbi:MAG TPA: Yip1 family protein [Mariniphaga sp.]|nr:Yip1 family protein [Mariniphaga sp.]
MEVSIKQFSNKIRHLIFKPTSFWKNEKLIPNGIQPLFLGHFLPLVLLTGAAEFFGQLLKGSGFYLMYPLMRSMREIILYLLMYVFSVFLTQKLIKPFEGKNHTSAVKKLITYSLMPVMLVSIVTSLFPFLYILDVLAFYSFFIFIVGVDELMEFPERKQTRYIVIALMGNLFIYSFLSLFLTRLVTSFL